MRKPIEFVTLLFDVYLHNMKKFGIFPKIKYNDQYSEVIAL